MHGQEARMTPTLFDCMTAAVSALRPLHPLGRVVRVSGGTVQVSGLSDRARLGDRARVLHQGRTLRGEVVQLGRELLHLLPEGPASGVSVGAAVRLDPAPNFAPGSHWIGRVVDPDGHPLDGRPLLPGPVPRDVCASPAPPHERRPLGARIETGLAVFHTLLPIARGQRIGLFAGSGVGKSMLLADLARGVAADVIVIALVGERGREVREFVEMVLGPQGMARAIVVAATSDRAPQVRRRCAWAATAVAEYFRDAGQQVLLLVDSVTRFAEAHRELAVASGEPAALRGFPASTGPAIASLCERAGPGGEDAGDITAIYSVLVAGSDMDEPVADMLRGVLDGHVVLDRGIAERGRFPAIDLLRSVSRSLPRVASDAENALIREARGHLGVYDRAELMIKAGLYQPGSDAGIDAAIACQSRLDEFLAMRDAKGIGSSFVALRNAISPSAAVVRAQRAADAKAGRA
jgi:flagellum-specific ATP synthase